MPRTEGPCGVVVWCQIHKVDGEWIDSPGTIPIEDPATAEQFAEAARATSAEVERAVTAARTCVAERRLTSIRPSVRGRLLVDMGRWIRDHSGAIVPESYYQWKNVAIGRME